MLLAQRWWFLWGMASPLLMSLGWALSIAITPYTIGVFESLPSALFGLWVYDKKRFLTNSVKFATVASVIVLCIIVFGYNATWIAPLLVLIVLSKVRFEKNAFLWSFGSMMLYMVLGIIPVYGIINFADITLHEMISVSDVLTRTTLLFLGAYFLRGALFGILLYIFYLKKVA